MDACQPGNPHLDDIIRFNEALDQAVAESIGFYSAHVEQARNLSLGMLGHDMRTRLNTIQLTASYLSALYAGAEVSAAASRLICSGKSIQSLLDDLVEAALPGDKQPSSRITCAGTLVRSGQSAHSFQSCMNLRRDPPRQSSEIAETPMTLQQDASALRVSPRASRGLRPRAKPHGSTRRHCPRIPGRKLREP